MAMVSEFVAAVNQICAERGINQESVFTALEEAVLSAYKKEFGKEEVENLMVELDRESGKFKLIAKKNVVKAVKDEETEISLTEAKKVYKQFKIGDQVEVELPSVDFGRIAAQTAKQAILQKISESEKQAILDEFSGKIGEVFTALMQRMQKGQAVMEIGKATAFMPQEEQIPNEFYKVGERYKVLLKEIQDTQSGKALVVSRSDPKFLELLFELEVPEIESGVVEIKACAREAGSRSKIAVISHQQGIDPIGSCVGQKGMRIANIMGELGVEKIDIIEWSDDLEQFVANALSPAKVEAVKIKDGVATVKVPEDQLSLAIGRDGQNVRLAYKLTETKIDIEGSGEKTSDGATDDDSKEDASSEGTSPKKKVKKVKDSSTEDVDTEETISESSEEKDVAQENESKNTEASNKKSSKKMSDEELDEEKSDEESSEEEKEEAGEKTSEKEEKSDTENSDEEKEESNAETSEKEEKSGEESTNTTE